MYQKTLTQLLIIVIAWMFMGSDSVSALGMGSTGTNDPVTLLAPESVQYEISEFRIDFDHGDANPYDPDGKTVTVPCFYYKSQLEPGQWCIRYAPFQSGRYRIRVFARQGSNIV